jgi:hypothetical protein
VHNNGPYAADPVTVTVTRTATAPADCSISPPTAADQVELPHSVDVTVDETFTIQCSKASSHTFSVDNVVSGPKEAVDNIGQSATEPHIDDRRRTTQLPPVSPLRLAGSPT